MLIQNGPIEKAIEEFKNIRLSVYKTDPTQIVRDTNAAERATKDHVGRWLFELLQNSDDAESSEVRIIIDNDTIYVADKGHSLKPGAVSAICGTDFSDKTTGTIGRKGVGFKSVYEVSKNPQVLTVDGGGIEFDPEKTKGWLRENDLNESHVPYQWVPFFIPWTDVQLQDPHLSDLKTKTFKTVVRLPGISLEKKQEIEELLNELPLHSLFAFRHLRQITAPGLEVVLRPGDDIWSISDSRGQTPVEWRVAKYTEHPHADLLEGLGSAEHKAISTDGISFLIAAPLKNACTVPTSDYLPIHVFYPTEQIGPVRLLIHAEFLVKSDRTALIPVDSNPLNAWIADRLANHICQFVNNSYLPESPSSHVALLVPFGERASHSVAETLWQRIADKAQTDLYFADIEARQKLIISEVRLISVSVRTDLARSLLEATGVRERLLHPSFDNDKEAHKALNELGCKKIHDQNLMFAITENAESLATDTQWVWVCWQWLSEWVAKVPYGEEHWKRIERVSSLPVVPVNGRLVKPSDLSEYIVTWKPDTSVGDLPDWLPLIFLDDWFRERIQNEHEHEPSVVKLSKKLGIVEPGADVIQRAIGQAIVQYWKDKQGDPGRFLRFIFEQDWHETAEASLSLRRCPIPLSQYVRGEIWSEARKAYFGREWSNDLLADLYEGRDDVAWVQRIGGNAERERSILSWLGCAATPRIIKDRGTNKNGIISYELPDECRAWRKKEFGDTDRTPTVDAVSRLEALTIEELSDSQVCALLTLLAKHWKEYYQGRSQAELSWYYYTTRSRVVRAFWWFQILHDIRPALTSKFDVPALTNCWLPDKRTEQAIGGLLPVVDVDAFGNNKEIIRQWLINAVGLRRRIEQITVEEWNALLTRHIPNNAPAERLVLEERLRDKVTGWYAVCLETTTEQANISERAFASCPLLCRRGDVWQYVADESRYLGDDNDTGKAFADDVWLFHIPVRVATDAVKYFGIISLSQSVEVNVTPEQPQSLLSGELNVRFRESLPYVWAWRSSQSKHAGDKLSVRLKGLVVYVVPTLKASLSLGGLHHEVERRWHVDDEKFYLCKDHANETELAQALANALNIRSEADFYENLLRCIDDRQRKEKLLSKGLSDTEIDRSIRDYASSPAVEEEQESPTKPAVELQGGITSKAISGGGNQKQKSDHITPAQVDKVPQGLSVRSPESVEQRLRIKDPHTTPYVLSSPPSGGTGTIVSRESTGTEREWHSLTEAEKLELEETGRIFAARELERMGFSVEKMPQGNPGFDLWAKKDEDELRVEVKAHSGRATVVDLTHREFKEYLGQQGYRWELWNVEHLAENDFRSVVITAYDSIPYDALETRTFRVDLKKCQRKVQD